MAVDCIKDGAFDYLSKSIALESPSEIVLIYAGRLVWFGFVLRAQGRREEARQHLLLDLDRALDGRCYLAALTSLAGLALLLADDGEAEQAVALHTLLSEHPYTAHAYWFSQTITPEITAAAAGLSERERSAAEERGRAQDVWEAAAKLAGDLAE